MKYIYYIAVIIVASTIAIVAYHSKVRPEPPGDEALVVNDRVISRDEFERLYSFPLARRTDRMDFVESLINRELFIQEAQMQGIDGEESFRRSMQNFYEQSLIKVLMDKKRASLDIKVGEGELDRYMDFMGIRLHMTIIRYDGTDPAGLGPPVETEKRVIDYADLSEEMQDMVVSLDPGESTGPVMIAGRYAAFRLDDMEKTGARAASGPDREALRLRLIERKKEDALSEWIDSLRDRARIDVLVSDERGAQ
jgi:hypothetical protein